MEFIPGSTGNTTAGGLQAYDAATGQQLWNRFVDVCTDGAPVCWPWRDNGKLYCLAVKTKEGYDPYGGESSYAPVDLCLLEMDAATGNDFVSTVIPFDRPPDSLREGGGLGIDGVMGTRHPEGSTDDTPPGKDWARFFELGPDRGDPSGSVGGGSMLRNVMVFPEAHVVIPVFRETLNLFAYDYVAKQIKWQKRGWDQIPMTVTDMAQQVNSGSKKGPDLGWEWVSRRWTPVVGTSTYGVVVNVVELTLFATCLTGPSDDAWEDPDYPSGFPSQPKLPARPGSVTKNRLDPPSNEPPINVPDYYLQDPPIQHSMWVKWFESLGSGSFGTASRSIDPENLNGVVDYLWEKTPGNATYAYNYTSLSAARANIALVNSDFEHALQFYRWNGTATYRVREAFQLLDVRTGAIQSELDLSSVTGTAQHDRETVNGTAKIVYFETVNEYHNPVDNLQAHGGGMVGDLTMPGPYSEPGYVPSAGGVAGDTGWNVYLAGTFLHPLNYGSEQIPDGMGYVWAPGDLKSAGAGAGLGIGHSSNAEYPRTAHQWYPLRPYAGGRRYSLEPRIWPGSRFNAVSVGDLVVFMPRTPGFDETTGEQPNQDRKNLVQAYRMPGFQRVWTFDTATFHGGAPNWKFSGGADSGHIDLAFGGLVANPVATSDRLYLACGYMTAGSDWIETLFELDIKTGELTKQRDFTGVPVWMESGIPRPTWQMFGDINQVGEMQLVRDTEGVGTLVWRGSWRQAWPGGGPVIRRLRVA